MAAPIDDLRPKFKMPAYLSVMPSRSPRDKAHTNLGHAKNALTHNSTSGKIRVHGAIYTWEDGDWQLMYEVWPGMLVSEAPWKLEEKSKK